jgi:sugar fermentation stimulation protein A
MLYLIQREDCTSFKIAEDIDLEYKNAFSKALNNGVKMLCYDCKLNNEEIRLNNRINYEQQL